MDDRGQLKAIETVYHGHRFRSRLEARWAVFLDQAGVKWEYEGQGYDLDGLWYLPDFYLPDLSAWMEVKGPPVVQGDEGWTKAEALARASGQRVFLFAGQMRRYPDGLRFLAREDQEGNDAGVGPVEVEWYECPLCHKVEPASSVDDMECMCVLMYAIRGVTERAAEAAMQARFERGRLR